MLFLPLFFNFFYMKIYLSAFLIAEIFISLLTLYSLTVIEMLVFMGEPLFVFCLCTITLITGWVFDAILTLSFCDNIDLTVHLELVVFLVSLHSLVPDSRDAL